MTTSTNPSTDNELLGRIADAVEDQARWQRAAVLPDVKETIDQALKKTRLRRAYESLDGTKTQAEIAVEAGVSNQAVSVWTKDWRDLGIAYETSEGKLRHLASLQSLGLDIEGED